MFAPGTKLYRIMERAADLMLLNVLFLISSLPIVTIGPSAAALWSSVQRLGTKRERGTVKGYLADFRQCFKSALIVWLILLAVAAALIFDLLLAQKLAGPLQLAAAFFMLLLALLGLAAGLAFPLLSLFENGAFATLKNALALSLAYPLRSASVLAINAFPVFLFIRYPVIFFSSGLIWLAIYFSGAAYIGSLILRPVFARFLPKEHFDEDTAQK